MKWIAFWAAISPAVAVGQELPSVSDVAAQISGREVSFSGEFGYYHGDPAVRVDGKFFPAQLAVDRDTLERLRDCSMDYGPTETCEISGQAEILVDGSQIGLIIYQVD